MTEFRVDSINQMAIKQIASVVLPNDNGPFFLGKPDPALAGLPAAEHPLSRYLLRLMRDEALEVEQQNELAALTVQVIHFGDIGPMLQFTYGTVIEQGRPQHVVTLKLNKVLRDVLHLAHAHQVDLQKVFVDGPRPEAPAKPPPEKQRVIMVKEESFEAPPASHWSQVRGANSYQPPPAPGGGPVERIVETEKAVISPGMFAFGAGLLAIPIAAAVGTHIGFTVGSQDGWTVFFIVLLPSEVLIALGGALGHFIWKSMRE